MAHFVVLYGGAVNKGILSLDSADRGFAALRAANQYSDSVIIFGVDYIIPKLAETTLSWLAEHGWPKEKIIFNPKGHNSIGETLAAMEILKLHNAKEVTLATSWYHVPRVWMVWKFLGFTGKIKFSNRAEN